MKSKFFKVFKKKRTIWVIIILLILGAIGYFVFGRGADLSSIQVGSVEKQNIEETVLATGQVVSETDLKLSFQSGGVVTRIFVKEGDKVSSGQTLAILDQASALAALTSAKGSLLQAQANYEKVLEGTAAEDIKVYQDAVEYANQDLGNAYSGALNKIDDAYIKVYNTLSVVRTIQNSYFSLADQQGIVVTDNKNKIEEAGARIKVSVDSAMLSSDRNVVDNSILNIVSDLGKVASSLESIRNMVDSGVYYLKVSSSDKTSLDTQKTNINTALTNVTASQQSIASYKIALQKAESQLAQQKAPATKAEIDAANAQIVSAQGQVDAASAQLSNLILRAPASGTITRVGIKVGEQASALNEVIDLQNVGDLYAEAYVSEANIASLKIGQPIEYTFDALGPDETFGGEILTMSPASTVVSGVVNYKVKGSISDVSSVKPGMTANMSVLVDKKENVLAVPSTAVINKENKKFVRIIDDLEKKTYHEVEVKTGMQADGGLVEILSGLNEGEKIVIYMKI